MSSHSDQLILLDKPVGLTSNHALQKVKRHLKAAKAGHFGTLDPLASGLLPIALGEATKFGRFLQDADKTYHATVQLGITTNTGDSEGEILQHRPLAWHSTSCDEATHALQNLLNTLHLQFSGAIWQTPPMFSALKKDGVALYKLARQGQEVERPARAVHIYTLRLTATRPDQFEMQVQCSKGTYIRSLAVDMGEVLGCGGHITALRRTQVAHFDVAQAVSLPQLLNQDRQVPHFVAHPPTSAFIPLNQMLVGIAKLTLAQPEAEKLNHGHRLLIPLSNLSLQPPLLPQGRKQYENTAETVSLKGLEQQAEVVAQAFYQSRFLGLVQIDFAHDMAQISPIRLVSTAVTQTSTL